GLADRQQPYAAHVAAGTLASRRDSRVHHVEVVSEIPLGFSTRIAAMLFVAGGGGNGESAGRIHAGLAGKAPDRAGRIGAAIIALACREATSALARQAPGTKNPPSVAVWGGRQTARYCWRAGGFCTSLCCFATLLGPAGRPGLGVLSLGL